MTQKFYTLRLITSLLGLLIATLPQAKALNVGAVSITLVTSPALILDSNSPCTGPQSAYVAFKVTNTSGATLNNLEVTLGNLGAGFVLAGGQVAKQYIGTLANGANDVVYWYISYPCTIGTTRSLSATVNDANTGVVSASATLTNTSSISANAGGLLVSQTISGSATIGKIIYIDVVYTFGGASNGDRYNLQPAGNSDFAAGCYQLMNSQIMASAVTAIPVNSVDKLYYTATTNQPGSGYTVTVRYFFQVICINVSTVAKSYAGQTSGSSIKYSGNFDTFAASTITANSTAGVTITKQVLSTNILPNDLITYKVTIINTTSTATVIDRIEDVLPTGFTFGSTLGTSDISAINANQMPAANATGTVIWSGGVSGGTAPFPYKSFYIPGNDSLELFYTARVSSTLGVYTNSATPYIGTVALGTVTATISTVKYSVSGTVFNDANGLSDATINGVGTNAGGLYAILVNGSNNVVQSVAIAANGVYAFSNISAGTYTVRLSTTAGTVGVAAPAISLPSGWTSSGEGIAAAGDGIVNTNASITLNAADITGLNFGIQTCSAASVGGTTTYSGTSLCSTTNSGTITLTGQTGDVVKWQTSTNSGATWSDITNTTTTYGFTNALNNQQYRAVVNNSGSCSDAFSSVTILSVTVMSVPTITLTQPTCSVATGTITVTSPSSGVTYSFDNGTTFQASATKSALATGTYQVIVKDNTSGCSSSAVATTINAQPATPSVPVTSITQPTCSVATGTITVTSPSSGVTYSFDNGTTFQASATKSALATGTYQVIVKDNTSGCSSSAVATTINAQPATPSVPVTSVTQPTCFVATGTITVTSPSSGVTYSFDNGTTFQASATKSALATGTYQVIVKDNTSGCSSTAVATTINAQPATPSVPVTSITQPTCFVATGTITVTSPSSGVTYSFDNGTTFQASATKSALATGTYQVIVKDNTSGCSSSAVATTVNAQPATPSVAVTSITQPTCSVATGTITVTSPSSGVTYSFDNGVTFQASATKSALAAGTYQVIVKNTTSNCTSTAVATTINPQPATPSVPVTSITQPTCSVATGTITVTSPSSGVTYSFDNGATFQASATKSALATGTYQVIVKDNTSGCSSTAVATTINAQPATPSVPVTSITQPTCFVATGTITVTSPSSGVTYSFDNGTTFQASATKSALATGTYQVIVKDNTSGCSSTAVATTINAQPATPSVPVTSITQPTCFVATGTITVTSPSSGVTYSFDNGANFQASNLLSAVSAGTYQVIVKDNTSGCNSSATSTTVNAQPVTPSVPVTSVTQPTCSVATGTITVTEPTEIGMTYSIDGIDYSNTTGIFNLVPPNTYNITAKNASGCISGSSTTTINPIVATPSVSITQPTCLTAKGGAIATTPTGTGFNYSINDVDYSNTTGEFTNLAVGTYTMTVKNASGCISVGTTFTINPIVATPQVTVVQPTCAVATGTITVTSPLTGVTYSFDNGVSYQASATLSALPTGTYQIIAKNDTQGCLSDTTLATINAQPVTPSVPLTTVTQPTCSVATGTITVTAPTGVGISYSIDGIDYTNTTGVFSNVLAGAYNVTAQSASGCISLTTHDTLNPLVSFTIKAILEGVYQTATGTMQTTLNQRGLLPGQTPIGQFGLTTPIGQPYKGTPWYYAGTEGDTITTYPSTVVDWVLISLRTDSMSATNVFRVAGWLHSDGTISFPSPCFSITNGDYFIVVEHRNHIGVMSPTKVTVLSGVLTYDFTTNDSYITINPPSFGEKLKGTKWVMYAGDGKKDTPTTNYDINFSDSQLWKIQSGVFDQYIYSDFNMDADVNFSDSFLWKLNNGRYSGVLH